MENSKRGRSRASHEKAPAPEGEDSYGPELAAFAAPHEVTPGVAFGKGATYASPGVVAGLVSTTLDRLQFVQE